MLPDRDRTCDLVGRALALPEGEREGFLQEAAGGDAGWLAELREALSRREEETAGMGPTSDVVGERAGEWVGRYRLIERLGEGGCGVVFRAEQFEPVRRQVAVKVIKPGMDSRAVIARFEAERQALALMNHPNIARVLDAGATATGRPYFVMELVQGIRITEYCDRHQLSTRERVELFVKVCQAVQHAHQKGIIHRDLKPSNILVAVDDGVAVPKVIDFGIAKAVTSVPLTDKTLHTALEQFLGTPAYMSPEQAEMSALDVDTRTDIYSLGVLLYELLSGRLPFEPGELLRAGVDEIRRRIREEDVQRPSTRLSTLQAGDLTRIARRRQVDPPKLMHLLRGDLDWIVMKCLEKDRVRRYETANGLAMDLQRHLGNEPVLARPPSAAYRMRKLVRRHRVAMTAGLAVLVALLAGLAVSLHRYAREREALRLARAAELTAVRSGEEAAMEAARNVQVVAFLKGVLRSVAAENAQGKDTTLLRTVLETTAAEVGTELADQPLVQAQLREIVGIVYRDLGESDRAEEQMREAFRLNEAGLGPAHTNTARTLNELGSILSDTGRLDEAERAQARSLELARRLYPAPHTNLVASLNNLALTRQKRGDLESAQALYLEALGQLERLGISEDAWLTGSILGNLAGVRAQQQRWDEAEAFYRQALALAEKAWTEPHPMVATRMNNLAAYLNERGKLDEAEALNRRALAIYRKLYGDRHPDVAMSLQNLAALLSDRGRHAEAEGYVREALEIFRSLGDAGATRLAIALNTAALGLTQQGRLAEALPLWRERMTVLRRVSHERDPEWGSTLAAIGSTGSELGWQRWQRAPGEAMGLAREAEASLRECLEVRRRILPPDHWLLVNTRNLAGVVAALIVRVDGTLSPEEREARLAGLERELVETAEAIERHPGIPAPFREERIRKARERVALLYEAWGKPAEAERWRRRSAAPPQG